VEGLKRVAFLLVVLALAVRLAVPTGWMPGEKSFQLTLCTGTDTQTVWMDSKGKLHKQEPHGDDAEQQPCAFGGLAALAVPADLAQDLQLHQLIEVTRIADAPASIGHGLAAPPPPQTGPPILI
jgi:hypothetical protein